VSLLDDHQGQLFDPDEYGPGRKPRRHPERLEQLVEPLAPGYTYLRDRRGVIPYAHLIAATTPEHASIALCGKVGTRITNAGVTSMIRCVECDLAQQML
jgi:hypothetical protein